MTLVREHQDICTSSFSHSSVVTTLFSSTKQCRYLSQVVTLNYVHYIYIYIYIYIVKFYCFLNQTTDLQIFYS